MTEYAMGPVLYVVERHAGRELGSIIRGELPEALRARGSTRLVYACRVDRLPEAAVLLQLPDGEIRRHMEALRGAGRLPPTNLADPPKKAEDKKGRLIGPEHWWKPRPPPRPEGWDEAMDRATRVPWR